MYLRISFKSQMLGRGVGVHAFLPFHDGYEDAQAPYPTLYFLPGYSANAEELATLLPLRRFSAEYGVAVIIPDGEISFYTDHPERCALFSSYVGDELVRVTRRMLPCLSTRREDTYIAGLSMGGYGTLKCVLQTPERYAGAAAFSAVADIEEFVAVQTPAEKRELQAVFGQSLEIPADCNLLTLAEKADAAQLPKLYMACGEQDALYAANVRLADKLTALGADIRFEHWTGIHNWEFWDAAVRKALDHLL